MHVIGLIGAPNVGKTTLFNQLTGKQQRVGNWSGVTVECFSAHLDLALEPIQLVDCPGISQLTLNLSGQAIDAKQTIQAVLSGQFSGLIQVIDACYLAQGLYLTTQLLDTHLPFCIVLTRLNVAKHRGLDIDIQKLAKQLARSVLDAEGEQLKPKLLTALEQCLKEPPKVQPIAMPRLIKQAQKQLAPLLESHPLLAPSSLALWHLEHPSSTIAESLPKVLDDIHKIHGEACDVVIADARYQQIAHWLAEVMTRTQGKVTWHHRLDQVLLNRYLALPCFLLLMYLMFATAMHMGKIFQEPLDVLAQAIFVDGLAYFLQWLQAPDWIVGLMAQGIGRGIHTTLCFIPVLGFMFLFLSFLEASGYMARGAFIIDRMMQTMGLPGRSFVPLIIGFGCNVPGIMATRTLAYPQERILTILMSPFMSCSARLAVYAIFVSAFFPKGGHNIVFSLYLIGLVFAVLTGLALRWTLLQGPSSPLVAELPDYCWPSWAVLWQQAQARLVAFIKRAGQLIVPACLVIGMAHALTVDGSYRVGDPHSVIAVIGRWLTPLFYPIGITDDNWPATVGLLTGTIAKEVVIGTLNTLYTQLAALTTTPELGSWDIIASLQLALSRMGEQLMVLTQGWFIPLGVGTGGEDWQHQVYGEMVRRFHSTTAAYAYLLFVLLYIPCISTLAVVAKELNGKWMLLSFAWSNIVAYSVSVLFYQWATVNQHGLQTLLWTAGIVGIWFIVIFMLRFYSHTCQTD